MWPVVTESARWFAGPQPPRLTSLCLVFRIHGMCDGTVVVFNAVSESDIWQPRGLRGLDLQPSEGHGRPSLICLKNILSSFYLPCVAWGWKVPREWGILIYCRVLGGISPRLFFVLIDGLHLNQLGIWLKRVFLGSALKNCWMSISGWGPRTSILTAFLGGSYVHWVKKSPLLKSDIVRVQTPLTGRSMIKVFNQPPCLLHILNSSGGAVVDGGAIPLIKSLCFNKGYSLISSLPVSSWAFLLFKPDFWPL